VRGGPAYSPRGRGGTRAAIARRSRRGLAPAAASAPRPRPAPARARWANINFLQRELRAVNQTFDTLVVNASNPIRPNFTSLLWTPTGTGNYRGYIM
jgi:hypothetical protein